MSSCEVIKQSNGDVSSDHTIINGVLRVKTNSNFNEDFSVRCTTSASSTVETPSFNVIVEDVADCTKATSYYGKDLSSKSYYTETFSTSDFDVATGIFLGRAMTLRDLYYEVNACNSLKVEHVSSCNLYKWDSVTGSCSNDEDSLKYDTISFDGSDKIRVNWKMGVQGSANHCVKCILASSGEIISSNVFSTTMPIDCKGSSVYTPASLSAGSGSFEV